LIDGFESHIGPGEAQLTAHPCSKQGKT
jgi:hypothetical protein